MVVTSGLGTEKKWYFIGEDSPQGIWDNIAEKMLVASQDSIRCSSVKKFKSYC